MHVMTNSLVICLLVRRMEREVRIIIWQRGTPSKPDRGPASLRDNCKEVGMERPPTLIPIHILERESVKSLMGYFFLGPLRKRIGELCWRSKPMGLNYGK
jgi:hypothetical protein